MAFLDFYLQQAQGPIAIPGAYENQNSELRVRVLNDHKAVFSIHASTHHPGQPYEATQDDEITDEGVLENTTIQYDKKLEAANIPCKLQISFSTTKAMVKQEGDCFPGFNVYANGVYFKTSSAVPSISIDHGLSDQHEF